MKHASVGIALSTIAFALVLAALATDALGESDLILPDGSSLTVGPRARWAVASSGDLVVNLDQGVLRVTGSQTGTTPVVIGTPASTLTLRRGIGIVSATPTSTTAILVSGDEMKVVANGRTQVVSRPGWQVTTHAGEPPGAPVQTPPGGLLTEIAQAPDR